MRRLLLIGSMLVALVAASAPPPHAAAPTPTLAGPPAPVLGISYRSRLGALAWLDPLTLQPLRGRKAPLAGHVGAYAFSDDRSVLAIGSWDLPELRFVNARTMRVLGDLRVEESGGHGIGATAWLRPDRLLVINSTDAAFDSPPVLVVVDPIARRVLRRVELPGPVYGAARDDATLVLVIGASGSFVPAKVAIADADGQVQTTVLPRISIGTIYDEAESDPHARIREPGLAVDPTSDRAFVVDADGTIAEIHLDTLETSYHEVAKPRSILARLTGWLVPAAQAKSVEGPWRSARWLGDGLIAVTGSDASLTRDASGKERVSYRAAGLQFVDARSWTTRAIDGGASDLVTAGDLVLASGGSYDGVSERTEAIGIAAYGHDGRQRWRIHPGENRWAQPGPGLAYVRLDDRVEIVDLATGTVVRALRRQGNAWPALLLGNSID